MMRGRELLSGRLAWPVLLTFYRRDGALLIHNTVGQGMTSILLIYPFFKSRHDRSIFRFPPLGLGYLASSLRKSGYDPKLLDCTFLDKEKALKMATEAKADIVGIYSMVTMREQSLMFAGHLRETCDILIAGGPLPSCDPASFVNYHALKCEACDYTKSRVASGGLTKPP